MRLLLLTPPMTQVNTPYPATPYLCGFLRAHASELELEVTQADPSLDLFLRIFSVDGLTMVRDELLDRAAEYGCADMPSSVAHFLDCSQAYIQSIGGVIRFLQGRDPSLALRIERGAFLPQGPRFEVASHDALDWAFGTLGSLDRAKHLASLYIDDIADAIRDGIDSHFELARYAESLAASASRFDPLAQALEPESTTLIDELLDQLTRELIETHQPDLVGLTAPFPGNVYAAFRMAQTIKATSGETPIVLGGGYVNTELRELSEPRVFDYVDYITLDDGERPLLALIKHLQEPSGGMNTLVRTFVRDHGVVVYKNDISASEVRFRDSGTPTYEGLVLENYVSLFEMLNPMHRLWSDQRWNKLTVAHGCYWKKCAFCDITLDYISRYDPASADLLVERIEALVNETGQSGFHLVDEAAPPAILRALAERLLQRHVTITWWGNIRFEKTFTPELAELLAASGCVALSGGLEVASDRLLKLMNKGVTVEQVARVTRAFSDAGIMVHAYLMYGFPSQTEQETIDSLERVRQLFTSGCIHSGFWHRFTATAHSPIGRDPARYGIRLERSVNARFARNDLAFVDSTGTDHEFLGNGLRRALYNYMHGNGLDFDVRHWFDARQSSPVPAATVEPNLIERALPQH